MDDVKHITKKMKQRFDRIEIILDKYNAATGSEDMSFRDLLADMILFADNNYMDFDHELEVAHLHADAETKA